MSFIRKFTNPIKKIPKKLKRLPKTVQKTAKKLHKVLGKFGSFCTLLPLNTLSGKLLVALQILVASIVVLGANYLIAQASGDQSMMDLVALPIRYLLIVALVVSIAFAVAFPLDRRGLIGNALVQSGYRQLSRTATNWTAVAIGTVTSVVVTLVLGNVVSSGLTGLRNPLSPALGVSTLAWILVLAFAVVTPGAYWLLNRRKRSFECDDLAVVGFDEGATDVRVDLKNVSARDVSLDRAKIVDSYGNGYRLDDGRRLRPGEVETISLPTEFTIQPRTISHRPLLSRIHGEEILAKVYPITGEVIPIRYEAS